MPPPVEELGFSVRKPITVAGGMLFGPMNERAYLDRLRGRGGESLRYTRAGSVAAPDPDHPGAIDRYDVEYDGLEAPIALYFDMYLPGPNGIPAGFHLADPQEPWRLAKSVVTDFAHERDDGTATSPPAMWTIIDRDGRVVGFARWTGARLELEMTPNLQRLVQEHVGHFVSLAPKPQMHEVLDDYFAIALPLHSEGLLRGARKPAAVLPEPGRVGGEDTGSGARPGPGMIVAFVVLGLLGVAALLFVLLR
jgi:hypothetical protein